MVTAQTITNVRSVDMYESKLVPNCGQFYTLIHFDTTEIIRLGGSTYRSRESLKH